MVAAIAGVPVRDRLFGGLFREAGRLMRERWKAYAFFAAICGAAAAIPVTGDPVNLLNYPVFRVWFAAAVIALFFIVPTAIRKLRPSFRMTLWRVVLTVTVLVLIGLVTDLGLLAAVIPGLVASVLLSQTLVIALLQSGEHPSLGALPAGITKAVRDSFRFTRGHFVTTLGIVALSLAILMVPLLIAMLAMIVLYVKAPPSLYAMAPVLYLTFIYFECVRYTLIVRWFRRLESETPAA